MEEMAKYDFNYSDLGSYRSSNQFPYGYTLTASPECVDWGPSGKPDHPDLIDQIGNFRVEKRSVQKYPSHWWPIGVEGDKKIYNGFDAFDDHVLTMVDNFGQYLVFSWKIPANDPERPSTLPADGIKYVHK